MAEVTKRYLKGKLYQVSPAELTADPDQTRKYFNPESVTELANSLLKQGMLHPILARRGDGGKLIIVSGERRTQAAIQAKLPEVPIIVTDGDPLEISIVENLLRENLTAVEEAEAIERLRSRNNYPLADLATMLGKSQASLSDILSINKLPASVKDDCRNQPKTPRYVLVEIAKQSSTQKMGSLYKKYKESGLTLGELRAKQKAAPSATPAVTVSFIDAWIKKLDVLDVAKLDPAQAAQLAEGLQTLQSTVSAKLLSLTPPAG